MRIHLSFLLLPIFLISYSSCFAVDLSIEQHMSTGLRERNHPVVEIKQYHQEVSTFYAESDGLPSSQILSIAISNGDVYAGSTNGLSVFTGEQWQNVESVPNESIDALYGLDESLYVASSSGLWQLKRGELMQQVDLGGLTVNGIDVLDSTVYLATNEGLFTLENGVLQRDDALLRLLNLRVKVNAVAVSNDNTVAVAAEAGLFVKTGILPWEAVYPHDEDGRSWAPRPVRAVDFDASGALWFTSPQGAGVLKDNWSLFEGKDGLPYNDFTTMDAGTKHQVWFGTSMGAIRADLNENGTEWHYRQGKRWLPGDGIHDVVVQGKKTWFATNNGVGLIENTPMTLQEKAAHYQYEVENYIKRTEYGYLSEVRLKDPNDKSEIIYSDSDNDGLWTSMYGAGECFAYGATKDPQSKQRADDAFKALRFLSTVTQGGEVEQEPGFVARTVVPTTEPDPNLRSSYTIEGMKRTKENDGLWKVYSPRYPLNKEGDYWYKTDTSSDELDGHYFFYGLYYDLVAETEEEKQLVRETVQGITDHMIRNNFVLVDHDGTPTRWAIFNPDIINRDPVWYPERGLNSLSMLSYLAVTEHITGDPKYGEIAKELQDKHHYDINAMIAKIQYGPGSGNQSDDEMAIMNYYSLIKYSNNDALRKEIQYSFFNYWAVMYPEMNPLFNFAFAACCLGETYSDPWGTYEISPWDGWLEDSVATLTGFSLDRRNWAYQNSHRTDLVPLSRQAIANYPNELPGRLRAHRVNGKVLPIENRHVNHWNHDPWTVNYGGDGRTLSSGAAFLLPYYMGLYYGFIQE